MHEMWTIVIDDCGCLSVFITMLDMAERIKVLLGVETLRDPQNIVLDESPNFPDAFDAAFVKLL